MDENEKAILMLSNHITKLKIQYEEENFLNYSNIKIIKKELRMLLQHKDTINLTLNKLKGEYMSLKRFSTLKAKINERNNWMALVDALRADKRSIQVLLLEYSQRFCLKENTIKNTDSTVEIGKLSRDQLYFECNKIQERLSNTTELIKEGKEKFLKQLKKDKNSYIDEIESIKTKINFEESLRNEILNKLIYHSRNVNPLKFGGNPYSEILNSKVDYLDPNILIRSEISS